MSKITNDGSGLAWDAL